MSRCASAAQPTAGDATLLAEQRRLMFEDVRTGRRKTAGAQLHRQRPHAGAGAACRRTPPGGTRVRLKPREIGAANWDDKLTLEFSGAAPQVAALAIDAVDVPTLYLAGDSTVTDQPDRADPRAGGRCCRASSRRDIAVANHAESGRDAEVLRHRAAPRQTAVEPQGRRLGHDPVRPQRPEIAVAADLRRRGDHLSLLAAHLHRRGPPPRRDAAARHLARTAQFRRARPHREQPRRLSRGRSGRRARGSASRSSISTR